MTQALYAPMNNKKKKKKKEHMLSFSTARVVWCPREGQGSICSRYSPATWPRPLESSYDGGRGGAGGRASGC
jgi:hypothetical protein